MVPVKTAPKTGGFLGIENIRAIGKWGFKDFLYNTWKKYGDLVEIKLGSSTSYLVTHPDYIRHISITAADRYGKGTSYDLIRKYALGNSIIAAEGDDWHWQRRLMAPFFTPRAVEQYAETIIAEGQKLIDSWEQLVDNGKTVDMSEEMLDLAAAIILKSIFGLSTNQHVINVMHDVDVILHFLAAKFRTVIALPLWIPTPTNRKYLEAKNRLHSYIKGIIAQRRALPENEWSQDLLSKLLLHKDEETNRYILDDLLVYEAVAFFIAGHETTARTLTYALYALSKNPEVEEKLIAEIKRVLGNRSPDIADLKQMPYVLQVIKETLRMYPAAPIFTRDAFKDDVLDGYQIKAGDTMMLYPYGTHRHPDFWDEPEKFMPERFTAEAEASRHPQAYYPFAAGQRICIGNNFSLLEAHTLLAMIYSRFRPRLREGFELKLEAASTLVPSNGLPMYIEDHSI